MCTPLQLRFIRKEIENKTVRESNLLKAAVQVAVSNCLSKRKSNLWTRKSGEYDDALVSHSEIEAISEVMEKATPWTPWQAKGGGKRG